MRLLAVAGLMAEPSLWPVFGNSDLEDSEFRALENT